MFRHNPYINGYSPCASLERLFWHYIVIVNSNYGIISRLTVAPSAA